MHVIYQVKLFFDFYDIILTDIEHFGFPNDALNLVYFIQTVCEKKAE